MRQFEYRVEVIGDHINGFYVADDIGKDGWELVATTKVRNPNDDAAYFTIQGIFKREAHEAIEMGKQFGVSWSNVYNIVTRKTWRHV